ncbi:MAG: hypothetical protein EXR47_00765 [Dehalococcoidia bacterium]|nr:hypothetical protein [Dehalococcoidia bacterium]
MKRRLVLGSAAILVALALIVPTVVLAQGASDADEILRSDVTDRVQLSDGSGLVTVAWPGTRGKTITVGGVSLKLPDDAELNGIIGEGNYSYEAISQPGFRRFPTPAYSIVRGQARMVVSIQTGEFIVTGGKPEDHQFLIDSLGEGKRFRTDGQ